MPKKTPLIDFAVKQYRKNLATGKFDKDAAANKALEDALKFYRKK